MSGEIPIFRIGPLLLISIQGELYDTRASQFQIDLLKAVREYNVENVVVDISAQEVVDSYVAGILGETAKMLSIMNAKLVLVGLRPEVTLTIVEMGMELDVMLSAVNVEAGLAKLGYELRQINESENSDQNKENFIQTIIADSTDA